MPVDSISIRKPVVAGMFYPESPEGLERNLRTMFSSAHVEQLNGKVRGLVVPHAGYVYSGITAAHAYSLVQNKHFDAVVIVGPSHREYFEGISIYPGDAFQTPLGQIPIETTLRDELVAYSKKIVSSPLGHKLEHSIEVQLPFLQLALNDFSFVPVVMGHQSGEMCTILGNALAYIAKHKNLLLIASSDLSHYHPYQEAVTLDNHVVTYIEQFDSKSWITEFEAEHLEACGGGPIAAVMSASKQLGANEAKVLYYCNSGDTSGDLSGVVGYLAAAFIQVN